MWFSAALPLYDFLGHLCEDRAIIVRSGCALSYSAFRECATRLACAARRARCEVLVYRFTTWGKTASRQAFCVFRIALRARWCQCSGCGGGRVSQFLSVVAIGDVLDADGVFRRGCVAPASGQRTPTAPQRFFASGNAWEARQNQLMLAPGSVLLLTSANGPIDIA